MKKAAGSLRIDLAQYREMEVFTQFSSDLDKATKDLLDHGVRLMELLKQPLSKPLPLHEQVILLVVANKKLFNDVPVKEMKTFRSDLMDFFRTKHANIIEELDTNKVLTDELTEQIINAAKEFKK